MKQLQTVHSFWDMFATLAVLIAALAIECLAVLRWVFHGDIYSLTAIHLLVCAFVSYWSYCIYKRNNHMALAVLAAPLIFASGPFGAGLCLLAAAARVFYTANSAAAPMAWLKNFFDYQKDNSIEHLRSRIAHGQEEFGPSHVEPFNDILSGESVLRKQLALAKIARYFRPNLAPLLLQAVHDPDAAVRVQAATAMARIERDFMKRRMELEKKLANTSLSDDAWLQLAQLYDDYAHAGLADQEERKTMRMRAIEIYDMHKNRDMDARLKLARLYLRDGNPKKTCELLMDIVQEGVSSEAIVWFMEALFRLNRYGELRRMARKYSGKIENADCFRMVPEIEALMTQWNKRPHDEKEGAYAHTG